MRILLAHNRQLARGGADVVYEREASALAGRGHQVVRFEVANADIDALGRVRAGARAVWNREAARDLADLLDRTRPHVVHVHTPFPLMSPVVFRVARHHGIPTVTTVHGYRYSCPVGTLRRDGRPCHDCVGRSLKLPAVVHGCYHDSRLATLPVAGGLSFHHALGTFSRDVDRFLALTSFGRDRLVDDGIPPSRVVVRPNFVPDPGPPLEQRSGALLFAGRLTEEKGVATLVTAWRTYRGPLRLVIAGDGPLRPLVDDLAHTDDRVDVLGWVGADEVGAHLARAEALVFPSEWHEALPLVVLEALAAGTPVVASDLPNVAELVDPEVSGWRFRTGDARSLVEVLEHLDEVDRAGAQRGARDAYEQHYREAPVMDQLEAVYAELVDGSPPSAGGPGAPSGTAVPVP